MWIVKLFMGIGFKIKLYAAAALGLVAIAVTIYSKGKTAEKNARLKSRLEGMKNAQKVEKEIENADRDTVIDINSKP